jgi:alkyldihydroxyacetonephosphate synthase
MLDRGLGIDTLKTATSWSNLHTLYEGVKTVLERAIAETVPRPLAHGLVMCRIDHAYREGAGLDFTYIFPRALGDELAQCQSIKRAAVDSVLENGGTISNYGVAENHLPLQQKGELTIVIRAIKNTLDPQGILNPGKLVTA